GGSEAGTFGEEAGGKARSTAYSTEAGRGRGVRQRGPCRTRRPRAHGRPDEGRVREADWRLPGRRGRVRRRVPRRAVQGGDPRPRGLARLSRTGEVRARRDPERGQPAA